MIFLQVDSQMVKKFPLL